jgi:parallel beta helix pectate lyase-like protein
MSKVRFTLNILAVAIFTLTVASMAQAQATRTWVSGVGDDANPCSRTAPCKTFAGAISKTAAGGEIDCLDPGGFGAVTITKSITIDGTHGAGFGSILSSSTNGVIVNAAGVIVTLRSLSINGGTPTAPGINGVRFLQGSKLNIEDCKIFNFTTTGVDQGAGVDIKMTASGASVNIKDTDIFNCTRGIRATTSTGFVSVLVENTAFQNNNQDGIRLENGGFASIRDSIISLNATGVNVTGGGNSGANLIGTMVVGNSAVGLNANNNTCRIGNSTFIGNVTGISQTAANTVKTFGDNNIADTIVGGAIQLIPQQ